MNLTKFDLIGLSAGTNINVGVGGTGDNVVDQVSGDSSTFLKVTNDSTFADSMDMAPAVNTTLRWNHSSVGNAGVRFYFKKTNDYSNNQLPMLAVRDTNVQVSPIRVSLAGNGAIGEIRILDSSGGAPYKSPINTILLNKWYRVEVYVKISAAQFRMYVYEDNSTTALVDSGWTTFAPGTATVFNQLWLGNFSTPTNPQMRVAHLLTTDNADAMIGPWAAAPQPSAGKWYVKGSGLATAAYVKTADGLKSVALKP